MIKMRNSDEERTYEDRMEHGDSNIIYYYIIFIHRIFKY